MTSVQLLSRGDPAADSLSAASLLSCETTELAGGTAWRLAGLALGIDTQAVDVVGTVLDRTGELLTVPDEHSRHGGGELGVAVQPRGPAIAHRRRI